ncbi:hypothetical protein DBV15_03071 [Temnothorax longispinosus]|uniref:Neurotransmitter-gated ion-channel ligand-binding domain-containing protein n=1 Tax=Temnothorax longispinosus TaxID=300112 RepID=A0A4S2KMU8_9HYME|nr:hypothetical protein DBV15_03071 [Temnothorax longispinosus]
MSERQTNDTYNDIFNKELGLESARIKIRDGVSVSLTEPGENATMCLSDLRGGGGGFYLITLWQVREDAKAYKPFALVAIVADDPIFFFCITLTFALWNVEREWTDYNLQWNESEYGGVKDLRITPNKLWKPDILMYNR